MTRADTPEMLRVAQELAASFRRAAAGADARHELSLAAVADLKASGYPALTVPKRLGGMGATLRQFAEAQQLLGAADTSLALVAAMNAHLLGAQGEAQRLGSEGRWSEALYAELAGASVRRGALSNSLASEPDLGSPSRGGLPATRADPLPGGGWQLRGRKSWSTGARALDYLVVTAATPGDEVWRFVVPADADGLRIKDTWQGSLALRASGSHDVVLEGVRVPGSHALPPRGGGPEGSAWFWTAVAATYLGAGQATLDALVSYARARVPTALGEPISTLPAVQGVCGQIRLELLAAGSLLHAVTAEWETGARGELLPRLAGVKVLCTNAAVRATDLALRVAGGAALTSALPLERLFRDVRAGLTHPPADDLAYGLLGRQLLEESGG